jgi:DNA-binding transcriptional regulator YiaG
MNCFHSYQRLNPRDHDRAEVELICGVCQRPFVVPEYRKDTAKYCSRKCTYEANKDTVQEARRVKATPKIIAINKARADSPEIRKLKGAFSNQKSQAYIRGVEWNLTFEQWYKIWVDSGHLDERGQGRDKYCMGRKGDVGPYSIDNVEIITNRENLSQSIINGVTRKGSRNPAAKVTKEDVRFIRENYGKIPRKELAAKFRISLAQLYDIYKKNSWKWVADEPQEGEDELEAGRPKVVQPIEPRKPTSKFTIEDIRYIRGQAGKISYAELAAQFGVRESTIQAIQKRRTWDKIDDGFPVYAGDEIRRGEDAGSAKLTEDAVRFIRAHEHDMDRYQLASLFGVNYSVIRSVQTRESWSWFEPDAPRIKSEDSRAVKLTPDNVRYIRAQQGIISAVELGKMFDISDIMVRLIWRRKSWAHIPDDPVTVESPDTQPAPIAPKSSPVRPPLPDFPEPRKIRGFFDIEPVD